MAAAVESVRKVGLLYIVTGCCPGPPGERLDEVDRAAWKRLRTRETIHDPPLTQEGWEQSRRAGCILATTLQEHLPERGGPGQQPVTIYSSPTSRTLSTAAAIAKQIRAESVVPAYALNCCAAAKTYGVARAFPLRPPPSETLDGVVLTCWPPMGEPSKVDERQRRGASFVKAVSDLAAKHENGEVIVLVTHREGIWGLYDQLGGELHTGYCSLHYYTFSIGSKLLAPWQHVAGGSGAREVPRRREVAATIAHAGVNAPVGTLSALLAEGAGQVAVGSQGGVRLWQTPGVPDVWVNAEPLPAGELVGLVSRVQFSEGEQGEAFVMVSRTCGQRGWLRVQDLEQTLPL